MKSFQLETHLNGSPPKEIQVPITGTGAVGLLCKFVRVNPGFAWSCIRRATHP